MTIPPRGNGGGRCGLRRIGIKPARHPRHEMVSGRADGKNVGTVGVPVKPNTHVKRDETGVGDSWTDLRGGGEVWVPAAITLTPPK